MRDIVVPGVLRGALFSVLVTTGTVLAQPSTQPTADAASSAGGNADLPPASAGSSNDQSTELANKLQNLIAGLMSVPFQNNFDYGGGAAGHGPQYTITYVQPFASYTFPSSTTLNVSTEPTDDWTAQHWTVPVIAGVSQLLKLGLQPISVGLAGKYTAVQPVDAPAWGIRLAMTLLFPT